MTGRGLLAIGILALQLAASARAADDLAAGVKKLLATGLKPSASALVAARTQYGALAKRPDFDARAKYAFALVLIEQRQLAEARGVLSEVLDERPEMLPAWQAKIWAALVSRSFPLALDDMRAAAAAMEKLDQGTAKSVVDDRRVLAERMGRGIGFLMALDTTKIPPAGLAAGREEIFSKIGIDQPAFLIAQHAIAAEIAAIDERLAAATKERAEAAEKQHEEQAEKKREASKQVADAEFQTLKTQADGAAQVRSADSEVEQIRTTLIKTQFDARAVEMALVAQDQYNTQQTEMYRKPNSNDVVIPRSAQPYVQMLQNNANRLRQQSLVLEAQIQALKMDLNSAIMRRDGVAAGSEETNAELTTKAARLKQAEKRINSALKQAPPPHSGKSPHALAEQRRSFSNFDPFPLEQEKERVLAWFEN